MAATTEALARGLLANDTGILETVDPFGRRQVPPILAAWPTELQRTTIFHGINSMQFFAEMQQRQQQAELIWHRTKSGTVREILDGVSAGRFQEIIEKAEKDKL